MSFIGDYFNHQRRVDRRFKQLEALNNLIDERNDRVNAATAELEELEARIAEIKALYPGKTEEEALKEHFELLKRESNSLETKIAVKKEELDGILDKLKIALQLDEIVLERRTLEKEKSALVQFKNSFIKVDDIIFAWYYLSDETSIAVSAFSYLQDTIYDDSDEDVKCKGLLYKSISGNRIIGFTRTLKDTLYDDDYDDEDYEKNSDEKLYMNTTAEVWITFTDACIAIGSDVYLNGAVSVSEINHVLKVYLEKYSVVENDEEELVITRKKAKK